MKQDKPDDVSNVPDTYIIKTFNEEKMIFQIHCITKKFWDENIFKTYI